MDISRERAQATSELLDACQLIGGAVDHPHWATAGLVSAIEHTGRRVGELKVQELVELIKAQEEHTRQVFSGGRK